MSPTRKTTSTGAATAAAVSGGKPAGKAVPPKSGSAAKSQAAKSSAEPVRRVSGSVGFVGIGPGDPGLLTVRALELMREAEVVVLSECGREPLLSYCPAGVTVVDGAFDADGALLAPAARAKTITGAAKSGKRVVRLVDGDGSLTGHVAEEAAACVKAGLAFQLVPGVSPVTAVPAFAGVPLTSRSVREVRVVDVADSKIDWAALASKDATLVLSGTTERALVAGAAAKLIEAGLDPATPVVTTWAGTTTEQRTVAGTLVDIAAALPSGPLYPSAVTVVGEVVDLRETLSWFETRPLFGWRILVPRTKEQSGALSSRLRSYGAVPEEVPTISVEPPRTPQQMERAIKGLVTGRYEWVAFTSRNAVKAVREKFEEYGLDA
ncbi:MAG TPA: SAM-dependent methyltransferase, partial [Sporichthya sp.]|nr:SAM-dependent methyltransferase [Sporichthya sp.]